MECLSEFARKMVQFIACRLDKGVKVHVLQVGTTLSHCGKTISRNEVWNQVKGRVKREQLCKTCFGAATEEFVISVNLEIAED